MKAIPETVTWHVSSYSSGSTNCVEVARSECTYVRDTKNRAGGALTFEQPSWAAFVTVAKDAR